MEEEVNMKKCKCISRNRPEEYQSIHSRKMSMLCAILPEGTKEYKDVFVDECIADDIQRLWDNGIFTLSSCCGHNGTFPKGVVISSEKDWKKAKELLPNDFEVNFWKLINRPNLKEKIIGILKQIGTIDTEEDMEKVIKIIGQL